MVKRAALKPLAVILAAVMALSLAACGNSGKSDTAATEKNNGAAVQGSSSDKKITITFQNIYPDPTTPSHKTLNELVKQYEADHPNITSNWIRSIRTSKK